MRQNKICFDNAVLRYVYSDCITLAVEYSAGCWKQELLGAITYRNSYPRHLSIMVKQQYYYNAVFYQLNLRNAVPRLNLLFPPRSDGATGSIKCLFSDIDGELLDAFILLFCQAWLYRECCVCSIHPS